MKLTYYGSGVPEDERSPYYVFDTKHTDTSAYDQSYGSRSDYVPNRELTEEDGTDLACNLGNYGVIYNYKIKVTNNGNKHRYLTYCLATSSNNVVYLKDSEGNVINGYALCKGTRSERVSDNMACMSIPAQSTSEYTVCVILTPNYAGGMENYLKLTDYPQIIETYETERSGIEKDRFFTGREYYKWDGTMLMLSRRPDELAQCEPALEGRKRDRGQRERVFARLHRQRIPFEAFTLRCRCLSARRLSVQDGVSAQRGSRSRVLLYLRQLSAGLHGRERSLLCRDLRHGVPLGRIRLVGYGGKHYAVLELRQVLGDVRERQYQPLGKRQRFF